jgi:7-cyano-7-deazaguanine synthase
LGCNREESGAYEDNSSEFYQAMERTLQLGTKSKPLMVMPVGNMMKAHIVKYGLELGAPIDLSWSCYHGGEVRCGICGPCLNRQRAFKANGLQDTVPYKHRIADKVEA